MAALIAMLPLLIFQRRTKKMASVRTPIGVLCFPVLWTPKPRAQGGEPVYQITLVLDAAAQKSPQWIECKRSVAEAIDEEFGKGKSADKQFVAGLKMPWRACSEKNYDGFDVPGGIFIAPWTKQRPGLVDIKRNEILVPEDVWAGMLCRATIAPFAYQQSGNKGVNFALNNVQICGKGERRLDGRKPAKEDFPDDQQTEDEDADVPF